MRKRGKEIKGRAKKEAPHSKIYIFCEGSTEEIYLLHFQNRRNNLEIIPIETEHTDALGIVNFAKNYLAKDPLNLDWGDRGYCVFDADPASNTNLNTVFDILRGSEKKGLRCIFSNPCFEVWFVMHFETAPFGKTAQQMKHRVKELVDKPDYSETTDIYDILSPLQEKALNNAKALDRNQREAYDSVYSYECNPYTNIFEFIEHIASLNDDGGK